MKPKLQPDQISGEEKIQTTERLSDSLRQAPTDLESPDWHGEILKERQRKIGANKAVFLSLEALKARCPR